MREALRWELAPLLVELGLPDFDLGSMLGSSRVLTQAIARWAYDQGAAGLVYHSRLDCRLTCWALFEGAAFEPVGDPEPLVPGDRDLVAVADLFGLVIESEPVADSSHPRPGG
jgi:hypothetical protein